MSTIPFSATAYRNYQQGAWPEAELYHPAPAPSAQVLPNLAIITKKLE
jgi:hypothetical protein